MPPTHILSACVLGLLLPFGVLAAPSSTEAPAPTPPMDAASTPAAPEPANGKHSENPNVPLYWQALKLLHSGPAAKWPEARQLLRRCTDAEYPLALNFVGLSTLEGQYGYKKSKGKARELFELSARRDNAVAMYYLAICQSSGIGTSKDPAKAIEVLTRLTTAPDLDFSIPTPPKEFMDAPKAVGRRDESDTKVHAEQAVDPKDELLANAHLLLGKLLAKANKPSEAHAHYVQAATAGLAGRAGLAEAANLAATNYAFGIGTPRDVAKASEMIAIAAKAARYSANKYVHALADQKRFDEFALMDAEDEIHTASMEAQTQLQNQIADTLANPKSKEYNPREAVKWYELAAEAKSTWAMLDLAFLYMGNALGAPDQAKACAWFKRAGEQGKHTLGWANYSICLEKGIGVAPDHQAAQQIWADKAKKHIVGLLGSLGKCPDAPLTYNQALELNQVWAKKEKNPHAQYLMAERCLNGWGVTINLNEAVAWLRKAVEGNHREAKTQLALLYLEWGPDIKGVSSWEVARTKGLALLKAAADQNDPDALCRLGWTYCQADGVPKDQALGMQYYEACLRLDPKSATALNNLSLQHRILANRAMTNGDAALASRETEKMLALLNQADALNGRYAAYNLGTIYREGVLVTKDLQKAFTYFETAASRNYDASSVQHTLGEMLENGEGMPASPREAAYHYRLAALAGSTEALVRLCQYYVESTDYTQDHDRALFWLGTLINKHKRPEYLADFGDILLKKQDYAAAFRLFQQLVESKDPRLVAECNERLSRCYENGWGVAPNPVKAATHLQVALKHENREALYRQSMILFKQGNSVEGRKLLIKACEKGYSTAIYNLGERYLSGDGVPKNEKAGIRNLRNLAKIGHAEAMILLIEKRLANESVAPQLEEALQYAERLDNLGHPRAGELRDKLSRIPVSSPSNT